MKYRIALYKGPRRVAVLGAAANLRDARSRLKALSGSARIEVYLDGAWELYE